MIAKFFKEIGRVDELGSGIRNAFKYTGIYTPGAIPQFIEDDVFRTIIPLKTTETVIAAPSWEEVRRKWGEKFGEKFGVGSEKSSEKILRLLYENQTLSASAIADMLGLSNRAVEKQLAKLKEKNLLIRIGPDKGGYWKINL